MNRQNPVAVASETLNIIKNGKYIAGGTEIIQILKSFTVCSVVPEKF